MSLLQTLLYKDYKNALKFSSDKCEVIARLADLK